jgi:uncharacterized membrane protein
MNQTIIMEGGRLARDAALRRPPVWWREPLFGVIPVHIVWNFIVILLVALIFWWLIRGSQKHGETPMDLLKKRYVAGEIDRETFLKMKEDISD